MKWPWQKKKKFKPGGFDKGAVEQGRAHIIRIFTETTGEPHKLKPTRDLRYIALRENLLRNSSGAIISRVSNTRRTSPTATTSPSWLEAR